ncbi:MAG: hydroxyethylthiazole kinase [Xylophilus ampelinus]
MLIVPPFLPAPGLPDDAAWLDAAMPGDAQGTFPVGRNLAWHGGRHLLAPRDGQGVALPVRSIADGTVVFVRARTPVDAPEHPLGYGDGPTSDAVVVVRHDTAIGADAQDEPVAVRFYSIYLHLHSVASTVQIGRSIHRKDPVGQAGHIYGEPDRIHFEIRCDADNLARLVGRGAGDLPLGRDGRTDALYGELHFRLPAGTALYATPPAPGTAAAPGAPPVRLRNDADWFVGLRYHRGETTLTTRDREGREVCPAYTEPDRGEYRLYERAQALSAAVRRANAGAGRPGDPVPSPSACFELLRFGRAIGPDPLTPADTPHWRRIGTPAGLLWVDLNAAGVTKYSDADFPHWTGWTLVDDDPARDNRCDSPTIRRLLDADGDRRVAPQEAESRLSAPAVLRRLSRTVCRIPNEWEAATLEARWGWLRSSTPENPRPLAGQDWDDFEAHAQALCFDCPELSAAQWCFEPRAFVEHFRQCGWMSLGEMTQLLPKRTAAFGKLELDWKQAKRRLLDGSTDTMPSGIYAALNETFRKYGMTSPLRQAHFFSQILQETGMLQFNMEGGGSRYFRTMYETVTAEEAGEDYDNRGSVAWRLGFVYHRVDSRRTLMTREQYVAQRPQRVREKAIALGNLQVGDGPRFRGRGLIQLTGRTNYMHYSAYRMRDYTTDAGAAALAADAAVSTDVSAFYWVSKSLGRALGQNIHRRADAGATDEDVQRVTCAVNGGETHLSQRSEYFRYVWGLLRDGPTPADTPAMQKQKLPN